MMKPRKGNIDVESKQLRLCLRIECNGYQIIGYTASGVKLAGLYYRLFYGTSEVIVVL